MISFEGLFYIVLEVNFREWCRFNPAWGNGAGARRHFIEVGCGQVARQMASR